MRPFPHPLYAPYRQTASYETTVPCSITNCVLPQATTTTGLTAGFDADLDLFLSHDGGDSWERPEHDLPYSSLGANQRVYALGSQFVLLGLPFPDPNVLMASSDGLSWHVVTTTFTPSGILGVANGRLFVWHNLSTSTYQISHTTDLINWTTINFSVTGSGSISGVAGIAYNGTKYVTGVARGGSNYVFDSTNLTSWTQRAAPVTVGALAAKSGGNFVLISASAVYSSPDAITWTSRSSGISFPLTVSCGTVTALADSYFVVAGSTTSAVGYSSDGVTWTTSATIQANNTARTIAYISNGKVYAASGDLNAPVKRSTDFSAWTSLTYIGIAPTYAYCKHGSDLYALCNAGAATAVAKLGATGWVLVGSIPYRTSATGLVAPHYYQGYLLSTGASSLLATSTYYGGASSYSTDNGTSWTAAPLPYSSSNAFAYTVIGNGQNIFVPKVNDSGNAMRSSDGGATWTSYSATGQPGGGWAGYRFTWTADGLFLDSMSGGTVYRSADNGVSFSTQSGIKSPHGAGGNTYARTSSGISSYLYGGGGKIFSGGTFIDAPFVPNEDFLQGGAHKHDGSAVAFLAESQLVATGPNIYWNGLYVSPNYGDFCPIYVLSEVESSSQTVFDLVAVIGAKVFVLLDDGYIYEFTYQPSMVTALSYDPGLPDEGDAGGGYFSYWNDVESDVLYATYGFSPWNYESLVSTRDGINWKVHPQGDPRLSWSGTITKLPGRGYGMFFQDDATGDFNFWITPNGDDVSDIRPTGLSGQYPRRSILVDGYFLTVRTGGVIYTQDFVTWDTDPTVDALVPGAANIFALGSRVAVFSASGGTYAYSDDYYDTWTVVSSELPGTSSNNRSMFKYGNRVVAIDAPSEDTTMTAYVTEDFETWTSHTFTMKARRSNSAGFMVAGDKVLYVGCNGFFALSSDLINWTPVYADFGATGGYGAWGGAVNNHAVIMDEGAPRVTLVPGIQTASFWTGFINSEAV